MKLRTKKIIAREFLTLIVLLLLSGLIGLCIYPYNSFRQSQIKSTEKEITAQQSKSDSLSFAYNKKRNAQETFFNSLSSEFNITASDQNTADKTWKILSKVYHSDSIPIKYDKTWDAELVKFIKSKGYNNGKEFEKFVGENLLNKNDSLNYQQSEKVNQSISALEIKATHLKHKIFDSNEQMKFSLLILIILLSIAYPFRFLILGIKWSVKTIKQKD
jgi:type II secretory pathway pseudopilin PulG